MKRLNSVFAISVVACFLSATGFAKSVLLVDPSAKKSSAGDSVLPSTFAGWEKSPGTRVSKSAAQADQANPQVLQEYGLQDSETATYRRGDRKIKVKAARFADATGAYGAFTFYRQPEMARERLCDQGASEGTHVLFYCTNVLVNVDLDKVTAMSAAELRQLAEAIPKVAGSLAEAPKLPLYLPETLRQNAKYVAGPIGLNKIDSPIKSAQVDYSLSPEVVIGNARTVDGLATMALIKYPTPKIAQLKLATLDEWGKSQKPIVDGLNKFASKRSGPIIALVMGEIADTEAKALLSKVNYDAEITWSEPTFNSPKDNIGNLVYNDMILALIIVAFMFVMGIAFGGFRVLMKRFFPGRLVDRPEDVEFIRLDLRD